MNLSPAAQPLRTLGIVSAGLLAWAGGLVPALPLWAPLESAFLAQAVADPSTLRPSRLGGWLSLSVFLAAALLLWPRLQPRTLVLAAIGAGIGFVVAGLLAASIGAVQLGFLGPALGLGLAAAVAALSVPDAGGSNRDPQEVRLMRARRLAARGELGPAWNEYRRLRPDRGLVPEWYDLSQRLEPRDPIQSRNILQAIASLEPAYRDVSARLAATAPELSTSQLDPTGRHNRLPVRLDTPEVVTLGRYEVVRELGRGAMGVVYLGRDPRINRTVAIKAIPLAEEFEASELDEARARFFREAETAGRLNHPGIVTIFDVGEIDDLAYIAMEYLEGEHLSERTEPGRLLPVPLVLELAARAADALHYAHNHKVIHRDIKPANIMYDAASDTLKLTDFGIARLTDVSRTRTGVILGTPSFMSPEQLEGKNVSGNTDLFALGVTLYQLLTGQLPFRGATMTKLMFAIANELHAAPSALRAELPPSIDDVVNRALAKDANERFADGASMAAALRDTAARLGGAHNAA